MRMSHSSHALSFADRQLLRRSFLRSGQCVQCFHASRRAQQPESNGQPAPQIGQNRNPTRQQRSTMISNEVSRLQRAPKARSAAPEPTARPRGAQEQADQKMVPGKPAFAQDVDVLAGGGGDMNLPQDDGLDEIPYSASDEHANVRPVLAKTPGIRFKPEALTNEALLQSGQGASTIAAKNFAGVVEDRLTSLSSSFHPDFRKRRPETLRQKVSQRQLVRLSPEEREQLSQPNDKESAYPRAHNFTRSRSSVRHAVVGRMIAGTYDVDGVLRNAEKYKQPVLNELAKMTKLNGSYLPSDSERFLKKVQSLLPASAMQRKTPAAT